MSTVFVAVAAAAAAAAPAAPADGWMAANGNMPNRDRAAQR